MFHAQVKVLGRLVCYKLVAFWQWCLYIRISACSSSRSYFRCRAFLNLGRRYCRGLSSVQNIVADLIDELGSTAMRLHCESWTCRCVRCSSVYHMRNLIRYRELCFLVVLSDNPRFPPNSLRMPCSIWITNDAACDLSKINPSRMNKLLYTFLAVDHFALELQSIQWLIQLYCGNAIHLDRADVGVDYFESTICCISFQQILMIAGNDFKRSL